jgi:hypothetical protein
MSVKPIAVDQRQARLLRYLAAARKRPVEDVLEEALYEYLARNGLDYKNRVSGPRNEIPIEEWRARLDELLREIRADIPKDVTPEEIEAEITAAYEELRQERAAASQLPSG